MVKIGLNHHFLGGVQQNFYLSLGGSMFCSQNLGGVLNVSLSLRGGGDISLFEFLGGVRVLRPLATNLRDPPLWVFLTPSHNTNQGS